MTVAQSRTAYDDVFEKFELAMTDPLGIRIAFDTQAAARTYMMRMHNARAIDRRDNAKTYPEGDPMHGQCIYDRLQCTIREGDDGSWFVYVEPRDKYVGEVESLSEIEADTPQISADEIKLLTKQESAE